MFQGQLYKKRNIPLNKKNNRYTDLYIFLEMAYRDWRFSVYWISYCWICQKYYWSPGSCIHLSCIIRNICRKNIYSKQTSKRVNNRLSLIYETRLKMPKDYLVSLSLMSASFTLKNGCTLLAHQITLKITLQYINLK